MRYSSLVDRISGESADVWAIHYEARAQRNRGEDILILSLGQESDQYTPTVIQQTAIDSIRNGRHHYAPVLGKDALRRAIAIRHQQYTGQAVTTDNVAVFSRRPEHPFRCVAVSPGIRQRGHCPGTLLCNLPSIGHDRGRATGFTAHLSGQWMPAGSGHPGTSDYKSDSGDLAELTEQPDRHHLFSRFSRLGRSTLHQT